MVKWKISQRSKQNTRNTVSEEKRQEINQSNPCVYHETLYSDENKSKKEKNMWPQQRWENSETIEHHVDHLDKNERTTTDSSAECSCGSEVNKKIDWILLKKKKKM